jgi:opacity protein-like surface antigen
MRVGAIVAAMLFLFCGAAVAQDDGYGYHYDASGDSGLPNYAGLRGSFAFSSSTNAKIPTAPPAALRASYNTGGGASIYVGTRLPFGFRTELEGLYRYLPLDTIMIGSTRTPVRGRAHVGAAMANLFFDLPVPDFPFRPFIGGGAGGAYVAANAHDNSTTYFRPSSWQFAYQLMGGAEIPLSQSSRFTAMYRWLHVNGPNGKCGPSGLTYAACKASLNTRSVDLGIEMDM